MRDLIAVTDLQLRTPHLESDHWLRENRVQPLVATLEIRTDVDAEATEDNLLTDSLNYGTVTRAIEHFVETLPPPPYRADDDDTLATGYPLDVLAESLCKVILFEASAPNVTLELRRPRALLTADCIGVRLTRSRSDYLPARTAGSNGEDYTLNPASTAQNSDTFFVRGLRRFIVIGLNPCERLDEQEVIVDLNCYPDDMNARLANGARAGWRGWRGMVKQLEAHLSTSAPLTIELITTSLAKLITAPPPPSDAGLPRWDVSRATVRLAKPVALQFAKHPSVQVTRRRSDFYGPDHRLYSTTTSASGPGLIHSAFLGIGTNIGDRVGNLADALQTLKELSRGEVEVVDTSFLYESEAMYHEEQDKFLNAAIRVSTSLEPPALLDLLKAVESDLGRDFSTFRNGPRIIDLDLLLYDDLVLDVSEEAAERKDRWLRVPHQSIQEREFVLRPLVDIAPEIRHPRLSRSLSDLFASLSRSTPSTVHRVFPLSRTRVFPYTRPNLFPCASPTSSTDNRTLIMSILNTTPDSFSDGGLNTELPNALVHALEHIQQGADILDIGGMSTRPGADDVSVEEETRRVVPLVEQLRASSTTAESAISIDTFRPEVAEAAVRAGADMVNDVHGGAEPGMLDTMARLGVPVVLMHSRGDSKTMTSLTDYGVEGVVAGVRTEMEAMVRRALEAGVARWNILVDPGIGFAKTSTQNFALVRRLESVVGESPLLREFPVLVGLSRKKFLGPDLATPDRLLGTVVGVTACVASGRCEVVRVHDTKEIKQAVEVADAIYRPSALVSGE
ncbi:hypothetical protein JCM10212_004284 [Sporobolomyces blumeae]